jgi:hypothetical protein
MIEDQGKLIPTLTADLGQSEAITLKDNADKLYKTPTYVLKLSQGTIEEATKCLEVYSPFVKDTTVSFELTSPSPQALFLDRFITL